MGPQTPTLCLPNYSLITQNEHQDHAGRVTLINRKRRKLVLFPMVMVSLIRCHT